MCMQKKDVGDAADVTGAIQKVAEGAAAATAVVGLVTPSPVATVVAAAAAPI